MALVLDLVTGLFSGNEGRNNPAVNQAVENESMPPEADTLPQLQEHTLVRESAVQALPGDLTAADAAAFVGTMARKAR